MTTHQNVSKHLAVLYQAGMVSRRKQGPSVRYALVDWTGWWLVEQMGRASRPTSTSCASSSATSPTPLATARRRTGRVRRPPAPLKTAAAVAGRPPTNPNSERAERRRLPATQPQPQLPPQQPSPAARPTDGCSEVLLVANTEGSLLSRLEPQLVQRRPSPSPFRTSSSKRISHSMHTNS
jgi:DNA-binding transcriptional ArsR family regulator